MLLKLKEDGKKFVNWGNEFNLDQNVFTILGMQSQSEYIEINEKKITVIEFEYFYLRLNITDKNISIYEKKGFKDEMLETVEFKRLIGKIVKYTKKHSLQRLFQ